MTSLASQLQRLSVPYTQSVWAPDKKRASLLFDPKEAANLDRQAVYAIGISGLEELEGLDPVFSEYTSSLFNLSSQTWERTLQSGEVNVKLNEALGRFLIQLSPYFLLKCAHKAIEWLIYRYHIHQMNIDALLRCVFPYHETKIFVRVVQLLPIDKETHQWNWIHSAGKSGAPLTRSTIINHSRSDPAFLTFLCDLVPTFIRTLGAGSHGVRPVVALWSCTVLGVTEERGFVTERIMAVLVPALVRGLKSKCVDYKAASYMVVAQLASHSTLQAEFVSSMLQVLTKHISAKLSREALMCLALICKTQKVQELPKKSFKKICHVPALVPLLAMLADKYDIMALLRCFLRHLLPAAVKVTTSASLSSSSAASDDELGHSGTIQYDNLLSSVLSEVTMETNLATELAVLVIEELVAAKESGRPEDEWRAASQAYLAVLQSRYAVSVDLAVEKLVGGSNTDVSPASLQVVLQAAVGGARGRLIDGSTSLLLALNHAHAATRTLAVTHLADVLKTEGSGQAGAEVAEMLLLRLTDDDSSVVAAVLDIGQTLQEAVPKSKLSEALLDLLKRKHNKPKWSSILERTAGLLCDAGMAAATQHLGLCLLPYLLVTQPGPAALAMPLAILRSPAADTDPILKTFSKKWVTQSQKKTPKETKIVAVVNNILVEGLAAAVTADDKSEMVAALCEQAQSDQRTCLLAIGALIEVIGQKFTKKAVAMEIAADLLKIVTSQVSSLTNVTGVIDDITSFALNLGTSVTVAGKDDDTGAPTAIWWALKALIKFIDANKAGLPDACWWSLDDPLVAVTVETLDLLVQISCNHGNTTPSDMSFWHELVRTLTQETLSVACLSRLACLLWTLHVSPSSHQVSAALQVAAAHLVARRWQKATKEELVELLESKDSPVLPCLLVCLGSSEEALRSGAVVCVKAARKVSKDVGRCTKLFKKVFKQQEEVNADHTHIQNILWKVLKDDANVCDLVTRPVSDDATPAAVKERLLYHLQITPNQCIMSKLIDVGHMVLDQCLVGDITSVNIDILRHLVERLGTDDAAGMTVDSPVLKLLLAAMRTSHTTRGLDLPAAIVMEQITKELFTALPSSAERGQVVSAILDVGETPTNPEVANQAHRLLQQLRLEWDHIQHEVTRDNQPTTPATVKSKRRSRAVTGLGGEALSWKRMTFLLEALQQRKTMKNSEPCVCGLFALLTKLQSEEGDEWEYRQRLVLAVIHNLTTKWQQLQLAPKQESVNVEVLVQVVRNQRANTQTKQHALGVMANLAFYFPEHLLHHVMSIFTFVGTGLLAADDEHSLRVVSRTITTIVPALLGARSNTAKAADELVTQIVQVFVDAQRSIPRHRSLAVFTTLVTTLGPETALWRVLTLLITTATVQRDNEPTPEQETTADTVSGSMEMDMEFGINVCEQFNVSAMVETATQLVQFLQWLAEQHETSEGKGKRKRTKSCSMSTVVNTTTLSGHQLRLLQFHLTRLLTRLLSTEALITQVVRGEETTSATFQKFVKEAVVYLLAVARTHNALITTSHGKFWKAIMGKAYEVIDKVLYLLPTRVLLEVVSGLLDLDLHGVRRKSLELLASKLQALLVDPPSEDQQTPLLEIVDRLLDISMAPNVKRDMDMTATQQMALFNLKLLCKILGEAHQARFVNVLKSVMSRVSAEDPPAVVGSVLLVEAEVVSVVRAHAIPHLPKLINPLLDLLANREFITEHELVLTCGLTALHRIVTTLPHFLSPYLRHILTVVCQLDSLTQDSDKKSQTALRLAAIRHQVATVVAPRVLVPALGDTFSEVLSSPQVSKMALTSVLSMAKDHVTSIGRDDLTAQHTPLLDFFCAALDIRNTTAKLSRAAVTGVEEAVIEAMLAMVVRLSEASFRPMFYKLYDWGCREDTEEARRRKLTFFRLADCLAAKLRSLFNLFIGQTLQAASSILVANNSLTGPVTYFGSGADSASLSCELLGYILDCLTKCMMHDTEGVFTGDVFNMLLQPLVDQIENFVGGDAAYEQRMSTHVVPCLSHFMVAAKEDSHQKALNYQVLLKARHVSPKVRFTSLRVISGAAVQMGDDYVLLLPETIPFIAELMEDECEEVERECQTVIAKLEEVLGESLQKYF